MHQVYRLAFFFFLALFSSPRVSKRLLFTEYFGKSGGEECYFERRRIMRIEEVEDNTFPSRGLVYSHEMKT